MSPEAYLPDPNSPEAFAAWRQSIESRLAQLKNNQPATATLGYATVNTIQAGIGAGVFVDIAGLAVTATVGTRRLIKVTTLVAVQQHTNPGVLEVAIDVDGGAIQSAIASVAAEAYLTFFVVGIHVAPSVGTHTYQISAATNTNTFDANTFTRSYVIVEDVGAAPA